MGLAAGTGIKTKATGTPKKSTAIATKKRSISAIRNLSAKAYGIEIKWLTKHHFKRPDFSTAKKQAARIETVLATNDVSYLKANLQTADLAAPHRVPYARLRDAILNETNIKSITRMADALFEASKHCEGAFSQVAKSALSITNAERTYYAKLASLYKKTRLSAQKALADLVANWKLPNISAIKGKAKLLLIQELNNLASNAPGSGPDSKVNAIVSDRIHLHITDAVTEPLTPRSSAARIAFPNDRVATTYKKSKIVSVTGELPTDPIGLGAVADDVSVAGTVFRGALFVDQFQRVFKPKNHLTAQTGTFSYDWVEVK
ncbi:hypothetical protein [Dyella psychrodurans]|uniref:Uncharacterized protein n=1 Tax=Dyella psychrodurans TaxID=1927960 RepID=A0A370XCF5_9GAMM|nr:hypothetical protein [Dyella psychrodurans]RDS86114.1 hypothetical protein DWU99_02255 [Dyella psychrodurans]